MSKIVAFQAVDTSVDVLLRAREVIEIEARTLDILARSLDLAFVRACELLCSAKGRIVVSGIGKSGHIGRKVAATLSATGSPAFYVHPSEAAHGDLGMVVEGDVIFAISNSGDTAELQAIYNYAENRGIKVVGVTSRRKSLMARRSDVCIVIPPAREACPVNIAPTSSTTQQLALGDAIAMVLMDMRGVTRANIKALHPGGAIGLRLASVGQIMHGKDKLPLVALDLPMDEVVSRMTRMGFGIAGVVDDAGHLAGIISDGDLRRHFKVLGDVTAQDVMTRNPKVLQEGMAAEDALRYLNETQVTCALVVADDALGGAVVACEAVVSDRLVPIGIIHVHDFLRIGLS